MEGAISVDRENYGPNHEIERVKLFSPTLVLGGVKNHVFVRIPTSKHSTILELDKHCDSAQKILRYQ